MAISKSTIPQRSWLSLVLALRPASLVVCGLTSRIFLEMLRCPSANPVEEAMSKSLFAILLVSVVGASGVAMYYYQQQNVKISQSSDLNNQVNQLQGQITALNTQITGLNKQIDSLNSQISQLQAHNTQLGGNNAQLISQTQQLQSQVSQLQS